MGAYMLVATRIPVFLDRFLPIFASLPFPVFPTFDGTACRGRTLNASGWR